MTISRSLYIAVRVISCAGMVNVVVGEVTLATYGVPLPVHPVKIFASDVFVAEIATCCPTAYDPLPVPLFTVRVLPTMYVAVRLTACAGIVTVVLAELELAKYCVSPVHATKIMEGRLLAVMVTCCPLVYDPLPLPLLTVSA